MPIAMHQEDSDYVMSSSENTQSSSQIEFTQATGTGSYYSDDHDSDSDTDEDGNNLCRYEVPWSLNDTKAPVLDVEVPLGCRMVRRSVVFKSGDDVLEILQTSGLDPELAARRESLILVRKVASVRRRAAFEP